MSDCVDLSVIVVNRNTWADLDACLQSVMAAGAVARLSTMGAVLPDVGRGGLTLEIWVVDNDSEDGSADLIRSQYAGVNLIANNQNIGFAAANNQALRQARGRYLLLLNPDTIVRPGALASLVSFMDTHPDAGIAGPHLLNADGSTQPSGRPTPTLYAELCDVFAIHHITGGERFWGRSRDYSRLQAVDSVHGACLLIRWEAMQAIGLLDEGFFMYFEETDWCVRAWQQGWKVYYVPEAEVVHRAMGSTGQRVEIFLVRAYYDSRMHYFRKHYGALSCWILRVALLVTSLAKLAILATARLTRAADDRSRQGQAAHRLIVALCLGRGYS